MSIYWRLFRMTRGFRLLLSTAALCGLGASVAGIGRLALSGYTLALVWQGQPLERVLLPVFGVAGCIGLRAVLEYWKESTGHRVAGMIKLRLRDQLYQHVLALGPSYFNQERTGDVVLSLVEGIEQLETFVGHYFPQFVVAAFTPLLVFGCMVWFDLLTALVFVFCALFTLVIPFFFTKWTTTQSLQRRQAYGALGADFLDAVKVWLLSRFLDKAGLMVRCWLNAPVVSIAAPWVCWQSIL